MIPDDRRLPVSLLSLRITVFLVMALWSVDKILNPGHAAGVFETFYFLGGVGPTALAAIGVVQLLLELAFVVGWLRTFTYGYVLVAHGLSTLASWSGYLEPFDNLLFFAGWPMLAGCLTLFLLREEDTIWSVDEARRGADGSGASAATENL